MPQNLPVGTQCLVDAAAVQQAIDQVAQAIGQQLADSDPVMMCVMQGGLIFAGHLLVRLDFSLTVDYVHVSRYGAATTGDALVWHRMPNIDPVSYTHLRAHET